MSQQNLDIASVFIMLAALIFSPQMAAVVGPYVVIVLASTIGASFALARRDKATRLNAAWFFVRIVGLAVLLTALIAAGAAAYFPTLHERALFVPIALMVGFIGDDWPKLLGKAMRGVFALVDLMRRGGGNA